MNKRETERLSRILPGGVPRWIRCYDNGGETADRYTVLFTGRWAGKARGYFPYLGMSERPFHPQGVGGHGETSGLPADVVRVGNSLRWPPAIGRRCHLGKRIRFEDLPEDCRKCVMQDYCDYWGINHAQVSA